jgi:hypothetical protein
MKLIMILLLAVQPTGLDLPPEGIYDGAAATTTAERIDPPPSPPSTETVPTFASDCDEMHYYRAAVGLPARFDGIGYRESRCINSESVHTSCCWGWWQLNVALHLRDSRLVDDYHACGVYSRSDVDSDTPGDKRRQACAAKALFDTVGYSAWAATA